jgi:uncharacterized membrane protein
MRVCCLIVFLLLGSFVCSQDLARVEGVVKDADSGMRLSGALVEIMKDGSAQPVNITVSDNNGFYSFHVEPWSFYTVYVRHGDSADMFKTPEAVRPGSVNTLNVNIRTAKPGVGGYVLERVGLGIVLLASILILGIVFIGLFKPKKESSLSDLKMRRNEIKNIMEVSHQKYLRREIDEQTYRAISQGKQQELVEIESKLMKMLKK